MQLNLLLLWLGLKPVFKAAVCKKSTEKNLLSQVRLWPAAVLR
jgi:hypothetical protein